MKDDLGNRMKGYERVTRNYLSPRSFHILRIDGKAFHTYCRQYGGGYSLALAERLIFAAQKTAHEIMGFKLAYLQSDEISFVFTSFDDLYTQVWFDGNVNKICSVASSLFTGWFNADREKDAPLGFFDARCFNVPHESEVVNYLIWRQKDAERNSLSSYCRQFFSHKELQNKKAGEQHDMLYSIGRNWNALESSQKRGVLLNSSRERVEPCPIFVKNREILLKAVLPELRKEIE